MNQLAHYVLCIAMTPGGDRAVGLTKLKGPTFLLNKVTFPGGTVEHGETPREAAVRELREECGLLVNEENVHLLDYVADDTREMHVYVAITDKVPYARQQEQEPVWILEVDAHLGYAASQPGQYASDFLANLTAARKRVAEVQGLALTQPL